MLYTGYAAMVRPTEHLWPHAGWRIDHVSVDLVWDFDDPAIPNTSRDTAATAIAAVSALWLSGLALGPHEAPSTDISRSVP
ncbi:hypothetical protein CQ14_40730 [Bradyrhizobium lablabi]|uniref:Uncharacterized protein n=1 Tax=Bradyrhizobium lablabi TaxID=722472 RepID=A0A0R3N7H1_9BRAD|nr:hypothetical protein [Bradyrhizobium lablabi]KRR28345.1 hypothetical protein CQ14_40730 [Bradyrhizobium lablabi]